MKDGRNDVVPHDTEDKGWWYQHGENLEDEFVNLCRERLNIVAQINPAKKLDKTAPDLIVNGVLADLKTQNTPFFTAGNYKHDPKFSVTFNRKDYERYKAKYPEIDIYFWLDWKQLKLELKNKTYEVDYLGGFYRIPFMQIAALIEAGAPEHTYIHRRSPEDRNAKSSFILDVRKFQCCFSSEDLENRS